MKRSPFSKNWLVHRIGAEYIARASKYARGSILDVGCGEKPYAALYTRRGGSYVGMDLPGRNSRTVDVYGDALSLPFQDGAFETIVSFQVLEHVQEPQAMVREIARVLAKGGHAIISAPHMWGLHEIPRDFYRFTQYGLAHLLESNGLEVVEISPMAGYWVTAGTRLCYYLETLRTKPLIPLFGLVFMLVQSLSLFLDRVHRVETDTWNYLAVGRKTC